MSEQSTGDVDIPTHCEACGTRLETGMVGIPESAIGNEPLLPSTTVMEAFCPNPDCSAHKPQGAVADPTGADRPGSLGGDNGGA